MMKTKMLLVLLSAVLFGCSKDTPIQTVPASFNLASPVNDSPNVPVSPRFEWGESINPENEAVVYDLYISESSDPDRLIASNLETTISMFRVDNGNGIR